jgi:hypothetical protein
MATVEKFDKIEKIHLDEIASTKTSEQTGTTRDSESASDNGIDKLKKTIQCDEISV